MKIIKFILSKLLICFVIITNAYSQEKNAKCKISIGTDLFSRYVWRGMDYGSAPSIQPSLSLNRGIFEIGVWGAYSVKGGYSEIDPYLKLTYKGISMIISDYYIQDESNPNNTGYFNYRHNETKHAFEITLQYKGPEKLPISLIAGTFIYGNDQKLKTDTSGNILSRKQFYSTYFELGYTLSLRKFYLDLYLGISPMEGLYANKAGIVNVGFTVYRSIKFTDEFSLNIKASLITNPQAKNMFFVFGTGFLI